jgi:hypothetical protein
MAPGIQRVLVCGGRDFTDKDFIEGVLHYILIKNGRDEPPHPDAVKRLIIITGAARGVDTIAYTWAVGLGAQGKLYPAKWELHVRQAGPIQNVQMLEEGKPELVIAFPGGSRTANMVQNAKAAGIEVIEVGEEYRGCI